MKQYFGTDGIRGIVGTEMNTTLCELLAGAVASWVQESNLPRVLFLGTDTRESKDLLKCSLIKVFLDCGIDVIDLGIVPTGLVSFVAKKYPVAGGIMVTSSHNPPNTNGIKIIDSNGYKLDEMMESLLEEKMNQKIYPIQENKGKILNGYSYVQDYIYTIFSWGISYQNTTIYLDCANGSMGKIAPTVFKKLGATVVVAHDHDTGQDINLECGAIYPNSIHVAMQENSCDIGFAFDGDGDRLVVVLKDGQVLDGDHLLSLFAEKNKSKSVVGTVMTNGGVEEYLLQHQIQLLRSDVGDRNVVQTMLEHNAKIGAESSGHVCNLEYNTTCDGLMNAVYIGKYLLEQEIVNLPKKYPSYLKNIEVNDEQKEKAKQISWSNVIGECVTEKQARGLVRVSGTENKIRVYLEDYSPNAKLTFDKLCDFVKQKLQ